MFGRRGHGKHRHHREGEHRARTAPLHVLRWSGRRCALLEIDLRGIPYDYCDAACATAHRQAVALMAELCADCDEEALGDTGCCAEHADPGEIELETASWRQAG